MFWNHLGRQNAFFLLGYFDFLNLKSIFLFCWVFETITGIRSNAVKRVSVVFYEPVNEPVTDVIDWPENPADGILLIPRRMSEGEWARAHGRQGK